MGNQNLWVNVDGEVVHPNAPEGAGGNGFFRSAEPTGSQSGDSPSIPSPFSPVGRNNSLTDFEKQALQNQSGKPEPEVKDSLTFPPTNSVPFSVTADSLNDFLTNAASTLPNGEAGHMAPSVDWSAETDDKGLVTKVNMIVTLKIVRPRFAGGRKMTDKEKDLIKKAEELIKTHEERHRAIAEEAYKRAFAKMHGKSEKLAADELAKVEAQMNKAQDDLDAKEGLIEAVRGSDGVATDVVCKPYIKPASTKP